MLVYLACLSDREYKLTPVNLPGFPHGIPVGDAAASVALHAVGTVVDEEVVVVFLVLTSTT